ncbi:hypothetical protein B0T26DRAFT_720171 [Lasiosphaeria miniovina]|uniref:Uncharacterized protein n=1 Tax=Lasiosphaeria miniovina TaxID=1954250 RepID=A0AA40A4D0_9PEZI|nr:uncharacterized protein B0T26DRAFT_720171 [Lasiosphaeria miniovina]KAK0709020.1 hypothetical protein B0T26DRAFT_720171 [Lasiosphaeria miniovina]
MVLSAFFLSLPFLQRITEYLLCSCSGSGVPFLDGPAPAMTTSLSHDIFPPPQSHGPEADKNQNGHLLSHTLEAFCFAVSRAGVWRGCPRQAQSELAAPLPFLAQALFGTVLGWQTDIVISEHGSNKRLRQGSLYALGLPALLCSWSVPRPCQTTLTIT